MINRVALLNVDIQKDFCAGGALAVPRGDEVVGPMNIVNNYAEGKGWLVLACRDWHPLNSSHFKKWSVHCVAESPGARFHPELKLPSSAIIINKGTDPEDDGYDVFSHIQKILDAKGITHLVVGGLATDYSVKAVVLSAAKAGYRVILLQDACRPVNLRPDDEAKALGEMKRAGVFFITTEGLKSFVFSSAWAAG